MNPLFFKLKSFWLLIIGKIKLHQTLFKRLSFGLIIVLILFIIAGFLYYNFYFKKDSLIKYVPKEAVLYSTLRINGEIKENQLAQNLFLTINSEYHLPEMDPMILNPYIGYNFALAIIPKESNFYEYNYLVLLDLRERPDENILKEKGLYWHYFKNQYFDTDVMAISNSPIIIEKVVAVRNQEWPALASRIGVTINLNQLKINKLGKVFIDIEALRKHFNELGDLKLKTLFASLGNTNVDELYLSIDFKDNTIIFSNSESTEQASLLLTRIPSNFIASLSTNNLQDHLTQILNVIYQLDPAYYKQILKNMEYSQGILNLDWQNDIFPLFRGESQLIVYPEQKYLLALKLNNSIDITQKLAKLEEVMGTYNLLNEPRQKEKQLPDGTHITQIIRDTSFAFEEVVIGDRKLRTLDKNGVEFGYFYNDNLLILANSLLLLNKLLYNEDLTEINNINLANFSTNLILDTDIYTDIWPVLANINNIDYSELNGKIWLKLE